jgi:RNA polymerase sigma factor (sigma-70 family)
MEHQKREELSDTEIVAGLEGKDVTGIVDCLYAQYFQETINLIKFMGGNEEDGADVFQESIIIMIQKIREGSFRGESSIKTFLSSIVKNLWLMEMRTRERRKKREERYYEGETWIENAPEAIPTVVSLKKVFDELGLVCKKILIGVYFENKSMKLLLEQFDFKNEQVLRNRKNICMGKLKKILSGNKEMIQSLKSDFVYE